MPDPTKAEEVLFGAKPGLIRPGEWVEIIDARREFLRPRLETYRLDRLGDVRCLSGVITHPKRGTLLGYIPLIGSPSCYSGEVLDHNGIFGGKFSHDQLHNQSPRRMIRVWALRRNGKWCIYQVHADKVLSLSPHAYLDSVTGVEVDDFWNTGDFLNQEGVSPTGVLKMLTRFLQGVQKRRKDALKEIDADLEHVRQEDRAVEIKLDKPFRSWR